MTTMSVNNELSLINDEIGTIYLKKEIFLKFIVIGDFGSGKTSIIHRYAEDTFATSYKITIGFDMLLKQIDYDEHTKINLQLWDIAGNARFGSLTAAYYRNTNAVVLVFDLTRLKTFNSLEKWLEDMKRRSNFTNIPIILLANKGDITYRNVPQDIDEFCKKSNILKWYITSAKDNVNIDEAFSILINDAVKIYNSPKHENEEIIILHKKHLKENNSIKQICCKLF